MEAELERLLQEWGVEEEYVGNFINQKVLKMRTIRLLTEKSLEKLFPEEGPRLEFSAQREIWLQEIAKSREHENSPTAHNQREREQIHFNTIEVVVFAKQSFQVMFISSNKYRFSETSLMSVGNT